MRCQDNIFIAKHWVTADKEGDNIIAGQAAVLRIYIYARHNTKIEALDLALITLRSCEKLTPRLSGF